MKISYSWLKDFIKIDETPEQVADILTQTGLEVEGIERVERIPGGLKGLVVGEIKECAPHPNADKLKLTKVDVGESDLLPIVCGAPNVAAGQKVIVAKVGTTIYPTNGEPFDIKKAKIRGEVSQGMLCAEDEIGLGTSHDGLLILNSDLPNGTAANKLFETGEDFIFEIGLTPNRGDATGHLGVARDLKAYLDRPLNLPNPKLERVEENNPISITIENTEACPRYSGITIRDIKVEPSPDWLQWRLKAIGLAPINNIVDITNYVMMGLGQPMHAFDANEVKGNKVVVKNLPAGEKFQTLDEEERTLHANDLMICNEQEGMCIAGVFGGIKSGIKNSTTDIFLESAYFSADHIRKTALQHGLSTDASFRFERGTDPEITLFALQWAVSLIIEHAGGKVCSEYVDIYPQPIEKKSIKTTFRNFHRLIGIQLPDDTIIHILNQLDIETKAVTDEGFTAIVPAYRSEVTREADLVEEVLRIYGFNNVPLEEDLSAGCMASFQEKEPYRLQEDISLVLAGKGFSEIQTNSLTNPRYYKELPLGGTPVEILNKSSEELGYMKTSPLYTALESIKYNINRKIKDLKLFELSKTYAVTGENKFKETEYLTIYLTGSQHEESWVTQHRPVSFHDISGVVFSIFQHLKIEEHQTEPTSGPIFDHGLEIRFHTKVVGRMGLLKKNCTQYFDIDQPVYYAELLWNDLIKAAKTDYMYAEISKYPEVRRDLSLVLDKNVSYNEIKDLSFKIERKLLNRMNVFSVYEGERLEPGKKSYAISFYLQDKGKTLTDKVIDKTMNGLIKTFENEVGAIIRK